jgi:hypothetical protein
MEKFKKNDLNAFLLYNIEHQNIINVFECFFPVLSSASLGLGGKMSAELTSTARLMASQSQRHRAFR